MTFVGLEVLTAVVTKCSLFWDRMPCSRLKVNDVSEEHEASILRIEKLAEQETKQRNLPSR
jgi:hypothetical protein